jgi:transcriptional regulator with XRE-family HTH domain
MQAVFEDLFYDLPMSQVVSRLRELRQAAGLSQRQLARLIGQDSSNVSFWERTGRLPRVDLVVPIAKALGVTVEELLGQPKPSRVTGPGGRARQLFAAVARLPRRQQQKIIDVVEALVAQQANGHSKAA